MTTTTTSAWYDARDRAGERCECRGECGSAHRLDEGGGQCPVRDHWPDVVDLAVTPADAAHQLADAVDLPAVQLAIRCSLCWAGAHTLARLLARTPTATPAAA